MTILPLPPWQPDLDIVNGQFTKTAQNVLPRADGYGPWKSLNAFSQPLAVGNDTYTKVLLHFDGTNGSTTITDDNAGGSAHTWTAAGNAQISTATYTLGGASGLFDGTGDWVTTADHADFTLSNSNFTIEAYVKAATDGTLLYIAGQQDSTQDATLSAWYLRRLNTNFIQIVLSDGASFTAVSGATSQITVARGWTHIAAVRNGNTVTLYIDGVVEATAGFSSSVFNSAKALRVGAGGEVTTNPWNGNIDEFRLSVGVARWTAAFTPPRKPYDTVANGTCRGYFYARNTDGTVSIFAATSTRILQLRNTDLDWVDVSKLNVAYTPLPTAQPGYHWQFAQFGSVVIAVQPNVPPQSFTLGSSIVFGNLSADSNLPQAAYIAIVNRFVVLMGLTSTPFKIKWSGLGDATGSQAWTAGVNGSDEQTFPDGGVVRGAAGGEYGVVFQDSVIRRMLYQPGDPRVFVFEKVTEDNGLLAPYSVVKAGTQILFLAQKGFFSMGPTGVPAPIGKEKFDRYFFSNYDSQKLHLIIGASDPEGQRCYFSFKSQGGGSPTSFDRLICYDTSLDRASLCTGINGDYIATLAAPGLTLENLDTISTSVDALTFSLDDVALAALPKTSIVDGSTHTLSFFSGLPLEATIDSAEQALDGQRRVRVQGFRPLSDAGTLYGSIGARERPADTVIYSTEQALTDHGDCPANVSTRLARARMRIPASTAWTFANGAEPTFQPEGAR